MPVYEYHCDSCRKNFTAYKKLANYREPQLHTCGALGVKVISKPMVAVDYPAYESPASGRRIEGKKAHLEELARTGCRLLEPGERQDAEKKRAVEDRKLDKIVDTTVDQIFSQVKG